MIGKTRGIILHHLKYGDSSIIAHVFTEDIGQRSFIFKGVRGKKSRMKSSLIQSLFVINLEFYHKRNAEIHFVKEFSLERTFVNFPYDVRKSSQAMFLAEVLNKCLLNEEKNKDLFDFIIHSLDYFDLKTQAQPNFHIHFLVKLTRYLGILPYTNGPQNRGFFDVREGVFDKSDPTHFNVFSERNTLILNDFLQLNFEDAHSLSISKSERNNFLEALLKFFSYHHFSMDNLMSLNVLKQVFI
jgi:DNA repair protein RecO (recombination protein O)